MLELSAARGCVASYDGVPRGVQPSRRIVLCWSPMNDVNPVPEAATRVGWHGCGLLQRE